MKRLVAFDLDGALAESKQAVDAEMASLLARLTHRLSVAVISGGDWPQFEVQLLAQLGKDANLTRLFLMPTSGTMLYRYKGIWRQIYADALSESERDKIVGSLETIVAALGFAQERSWGTRIEDRGTQITFSGLGQEAPPAAKLAWDPTFAKRQKVQAMLTPRLPGFVVRIGGSTSVDITREGVDKGYGITRLAKAANLALSDILFMGDALYPGGNDYAVRGAGVDCIAVRDVEETKHILEAVLLCGQ